MRLTINNHTHTFISLQTFRSRWGLPDDFTMARFEAKNWEGLGSVQGRGSALARVKQQVLASVPAVVTPTSLIDQIDLLAIVFRRELEAVNKLIGLRRVELDFAVAGFQDIIQAASYHLIQLVHTYRHNIDQIVSHFNFTVVYQAWLDDSVRLSSTVHPYRHNNRQFEVRVVYSAYGRVGLEVTAPGNERYYISDASLACPSGSYMETLTRQVAEELCRAIIQGLAQDQQ